MILIDMNFMIILQAAISILLIIVILFQNKGSGLGVVGGDIGGGSYHTKRGFEKFLTQSTIILSMLFISVSLAVHLV